MKLQKFPDKFYWGATTAAHQVEGGLVNDWTQWEEAYARDVAKNSHERLVVVNKLLGYKAPNWGAVHNEALDINNYISGRATDHYNRYEEDFDIAQKLNHNAHRFSLAWERIQPEEFYFDLKEIEHYRKVIYALKKRGMEPFVTIWHYSLPVWFINSGGWTKPNSVDRFLEYVDKVVNMLGDEATYWMTMNEPFGYAIQAYMDPVRPPYGVNVINYFKAFHNLVVAHNEAYKLIKSKLPNAKVSVANSFIYYEAHHNRIQNRIIKKLMDWFVNYRFHNKTVKAQDFIGLNYYHHNLIDNFPGQYKGKLPTSDLGWELNTKGFYQIIKNLQKYNKPIIVTEHGLADKDDKDRSWYLKESLKAMLKAIAEGADIQGYLHWSLTDNLEWEFGFWPRFGLIEIDYKTLERRVRPSAIEYAKIIKQNGLEV